MGVVATPCNLREWHGLRQLNHHLHGLCKGKYFYSVLLKVKYALLHSEKGDNMQSLPIHSSQLLLIKEALSVAKARLANVPNPKLNSIYLALQGVYGNCRHGANLFTRHTDHIAGGIHGYGIKCGCKSGR
jgi:hypothetical protein